MGQYKNNKTKVKCICKLCGHEKNTTPMCIYNAPDCSNCFVLYKQKKRENLIAKLDEQNRNITIIGDYNNAHTRIEVIFNNCGHRCFAIPNSLLNGRGCPVCHGSVVIEGVNDLATTRPDLVQYLVNKEDANTHTRSSNEKALCICPNCKTQKELSLNDLDRRGFSCQICSDGVSYPNKFGRSFLKQLPVKNLKPEYQPKWATPYRYDNYFEYNDKRYILEMDGGFHGMDNGLSGVSAEESIFIDNLKDKLAKEHNIEVIRIECVESNGEYIRNNILSSKLSHIFDLSIIDWNKCEIDANRSLLLDVCNFYNTSEDKRCEYIAEQLDSTIPSVYRYLIKGTELGLCDYKNPRCKQIEVYDGDFVNLLHIFPSVLECARRLSEMYKIDYNGASIRYAAMHNNYYRGLNFKFT